MSEIIVLQHAACETPGLIEEALREAGVRLRSSRTFAGEPVPAWDEAAGLVVMGGPMSVYEGAHYPFLKDEMRLIEQALLADKPILGVCLGSQLLAAALGAEVRPGRQKEIGWHEVTLNPPAREDALWHGIEGHFVAYHWHGDVFDLPRDAVGLASSALTQHQAFRCGHRAYGLLCHIEVTKPMIQRMVEAFPDDMAQAGIDGGAIVEDADRHLPGLRGIARQVFGRWAELLEQ